MYFFYYLYTLTYNFVLINMLVVTPLTYNSLSLSPQLKPSNIIVPNTDKVTMSDMKSHKWDNALQGVHNQELMNNIKASSENSCHCRHLFKHAIML